MSGKLVAFTVLDSLVFLHTLGMLGPVGLTAVGVSCTNMSVTIVMRCRNRAMNKFNVAIFFAALLVIGACAEPRKLLATSEGAKLVEAEEHQRILAELEEVHQLRERMLQEGKIPCCCCPTRVLH